MSLPPLQIPLLHPPRPVTALERERYEKNLLIPGIGEAGQARLLAARVLVIGAGGLGSPVLFYLAAAGVGTIGIADPDGVAPSNLQRQIIHCEDSIGSAKSHSAATRLAALNSSITVKTYGRITLKFLHEHGREWDLLVDCTDTFDSKYLIADWCKESGIPLVWGTAVAMNYQVASFWSAPPAPYPPTSLRSLHPLPPKPGTTPAASSVGILGPVAGEAGTIMATEAVKLIAGFGEPLLGRVLVSDALKRRTTIVEFAELPGD